MAGDTFASPSSLSAALCGVLATCRAVDAVASGDYNSAFCAIRPPGHHAGANGTTARRDKAGAPLSDRCGQGFCLLNNAAIGAKYALHEHANVIRRVAIIDWDLHHGNGTEEIVGAWDEVFYASLHGAEPAFYPETAQAFEKTPRRLNVPLPRGTSAADFISAYDEHVIPAIRAFDPDLLIISCGFDAHEVRAQALVGPCAIICT